MINQYKTQLALELTDLFEAASKDLNFHYRVHERGNENNFLYFLFTQERLLISVILDSLKIVVTDFL